MVKVSLRAASRRYVIRISFFVSLKYLILRVFVETPLVSSSSFRMTTFGCDFIFLIGRRPVLFAVGSQPMIEIERSLERLFVEESNDLARDTGKSGAGHGGDWCL